VSVRPLSDVRAIAAIAMGLLLVSLVALASGGSPWHAGGRQDVPVGVVSAVAAAAGALVIGSLLLVWMGTPSAEKRRRRRRRPGLDRPHARTSLIVHG
jgi:membrane associated rhomboid family serine protease